jgi:hypothetical protein
VKLGGRLCRVGTRQKADAERQVVVRTATTSRLMFRTPARAWFSTLRSRWPSSPRRSPRSPTDRGSHRALRSQPPRADRRSRVRRRVPGRSRRWWSCCGSSAARGPPTPSSGSRPPPCPHLPASGTSRVSGTWGDATRRPQGPPGVATLGGKGRSPAPFSRGERSVRCAAPGAAHRGERRVRNATPAAMSAGGMSHAHARSAWSGGGPGSVVGSSRRTCTRCAFAAMASGVSSMPSEAR